MEKIKILVIDNYDSFVYNLVHYLKDLGAEVTVVRNNKIDFNSLDDYDKILLSPGPGIPNEAGDLLKVIDLVVGKKPILGVCLGHQALGEHFGGTLVNLDKVYHGVATEISKTKSTDYLLDGIDEKFNVGRYHSWVVSSEQFPNCLEITSIDENGQIMSFRHKELDISGVQFHPESILTEEGKKMMKNWMNYSSK